MKNVIVIGANGYIGNPLVQKLIFSGNYNVFGIDNDCKTTFVESLETQSIIPSTTCMHKAKRLMESGRYAFEYLDIVQDYEKLETIIKKFQPEIIVNLAQQPSGPFSQISAGHASHTLMNNINGTNNVLWLMKENVPGCHLVTIGTMGEYQHSIGVDIPEGYFTFERNGKTSEETLFPRRPGSFYHLTKVASSNMIDMCCRLWNLKVTDIMQGVVFGLYTPETEKTDLHSSLFVDECFGTVLNRFIAQAVTNTPLTVFGEGVHSRGFISLNDSIQALMLAIENPPTLENKPRVWNQLSNWYKMIELAEMVQKIGNEKFDLNVQISHVDSKRKENCSNHYYNICTDTLKSLGYNPTRTIEQEVEYVIQKLLENKEYIDKFYWCFDCHIIF